MFINHDKNLCILVPSATEAAPLEIAVNIADCRTLIDDSNSSSNETESTAQGIYFYISSLTLSLTLSHVRF